MWPVQEAMGAASAALLFSPQSSSSHLLVAPRAIEGSCDRVPRTAHQVGELGQQDQPAQHFADEQENVQPGFAIAGKIASLNDLKESHGRDTQQVQQDCN